MRRVCYITGTRADFGLMVRTLQLAQQRGSLDVSVCVTGAHLAREYGHTVQEVERSGLRICGRVPVKLDGSTGAVMVRALGEEIIGITDVLERERPDMVLVLGDRGEMLAGALAAVHMGIPVVHVHGGERSGTVDEPVRHAISKLAHYHLVATEGARERLVRMGEQPEHVFVTGAPGLDGLKALASRNRDELCAEFGFDPQRRVALVIFHGVLQEASDAGRQMDELMRAVLDCGLQALVLKPNSDAGGRDIGLVLERYADSPGVKLATHLDKRDYASWLASADVMVGNSSSGIIEAATLGLRVVNVGSRQRYRERNSNTVDVPPVRTAIAEAISSSLSSGRGQWKNVYGEEGTARKIVELLVSLSINPELMYKANAY